MLDGLNAVEITLLRTKTRVEDLWGRKKHVSLAEGSQGKMTLEQTGQKSKELIKKNIWYRGTSPKALSQKHTLPERGNPKRHMGHLWNEQGHQQLEMRSST